MIRFLTVVAILILASVMLSCTAQEGSVSSVPPVKSLLSEGEYIPDIATFLQIGACSPSGYTWDGNTAYFRSGMSGSSQVYRLTDEKWPYKTGQSLNHGRSYCHTDNQARCDVW